MSEDVVSVLGSLQNTADYYSFLVTQTQEFSLDLSSLSGEPMLALISGNGSLVTNTVTASLTIGFPAGYDGSYSISLNPGTYYAQVTGGRGTTPAYSLEISASAPALGSAFTDKAGKSQVNAANIGTLTSVGETVAGGFSGVSGTDWYEFQVETTSKVNLRLTADESGAQPNIDAEFYFMILNSSGQTIGYSTPEGNPSIVETLTGGIYFLEINDGDVQGSPDYSLTATATAVSANGTQTIVDQAGHTLQTSDFLGTIGSTGTISTPTTITTGNGIQDAGSGNAVIAVPAGKDYVTTEGNNTIIASYGSPTVAASTGNPLIFGGSSSLDFFGGSGAATIIGGTSTNSVTGGSGSLLMFAQSTTTFTPGSGSSTIIGGQGNLTAALGAQGGLIFGGTGLNNLSAALGATAATSYLIGVGNGDTLTASGAGEAVLIGGTGAETLNAAASTGSLDAVIGGSGAENIVGGANSNYFVAGSGNETLTGGSGVNAYAFVSGSAARTNTITNFGNSSVILLYGFSPNAGSAALSTASVSGGSTILTLSDQTRIILSGVTNPSAVNIN